MLERDPRPDKHGVALKELLLTTSLTQLCRRTIAVAAAGGLVLGLISAPMTVDTGSGLPASAIALADDEDDDDNSGSGSDSSSHDDDDDDYDDHDDDDYDDDDYDDDDYDDDDYDDDLDEYEDEDDDDIYETEIEVKGTAATYEEVHAVVTSILYALHLNYDNAEVEVEYDEDGVYEIEIEGGGYNDLSIEVEATHTEDGTVYDVQVETGDNEVGYEVYVGGTEQPPAETIQSIISNWEAALTPEQEEAVLSNGFETPPAQ